MLYRIVFLLMINSAVLYCSEIKYSLDTNISSDMDWHLDNDYRFRTLVKMEQLPQRYQNFLEGFPVMQLFGSSVMGIIYSLPSETSNWDKEKFKEHPIWWNWYYNITHGPVIDHDSFLINYIEHPIVGAYYYTWGRESGLSRFESTIMTTALSTFYWEYGWEALIEPPSLQDLIVTPLFGSMLGEQIFKIKQKIDMNDGYLWGSKKIGTIASILLDPIGESNKAIKKFLRKKDIDTDVNFEVFYTPIRLPASDTSKPLSDEFHSSGRKGVRVRIRF